MTLGELRATAKSSQDGWLISWTSMGYIVSKGLMPEMRLEAERAGKRHVRLFQSLDTAARVMVEDIGVSSYMVQDRRPGRRDGF